MAVAVIFVADEVDALGGIQRALGTLANRLSTYGYEVWLVGIFDAVS